MVHVRECCVPARIKQYYVFNDSSIQSQHMFHNNKSKWTINSVSQCFVFWSLHCTRFTLNVLQIINSQVLLNTQWTQIWTFKCASNSSGVVCRICSNYTDFFVLDLYCSLIIKTRHTEIVCLFVALSLFFLWHSFEITIVHFSTVGDVSYETVS